MTEVLYRRDGDQYVPTAAAGSPWHPGLLHGASVSGLIGHVAWQWVSEQTDFFVNRLSIDLLRPVPAVPLSVQREVLRDGRRLKLVRFSVLAGGRLVCKAEALAQKQTAVELPEYAPAPMAAPELFDSLPLSTVQAMLDRKGLDLPYGLHSLVELREILPWNETGKGLSWVRIPATIVEGEPLAPLVNAALQSDLGNGAGQLNLGNRTGTINADITLSLFRYPESEWLCFESEARLPQTGVGLIHTRLYDRRGECGHILQSVQVNPEYQG
jgi:acyl-CoA thioesterase